MYRPILVAALTSLLLASPAAAQPRHRAPPQSKGKHKGHHKQKKPHKHRAPPAEPRLPVREPPVINDIQPSEGPPRSVVLIKGDHFDPTTKVRFNGRWIRIVSMTKTELKVMIPGRAVTDHFVIHKPGFTDLTAPRPFNVIRPPVIMGFRPRLGAAGTVVRIRGQNFLPTDTFVIGDVQLQTQRIRPNKARVTIPVGARAGRIGVRRGAQVAAWSRRPFDVLGPPPVITRFNPTQGPRGTVVRIDGRNFEPTDVVLLSGRPLAIRSRSPNHFEVVISHQRSGQLVVRGRRGRSAMAAGAFTVLRPPVIRRFFPQFGPPGTRVTIRGHGFAPGDQVYVGNAMLTVRTLHDRQILAEVPAGVPGGRLYVQRGARKFFARGGFTVTLPPVITDVSPRSAPPGATVLIRGRAFLPGVSVTLGGRRLRIVQRRLPGEVAVVIPPGAHSGQFVVVTRGGSARTPFIFQVLQFPTVSSFFPLHGLPGTEVTIRGAYFPPGLKVWLLNTVLPLTQVTSNTLKVRIPAVLKGRAGRFKLTAYGREFHTRLPFRVDLPRPALEFTFYPKVGRRGSEVTLILTPPRPRVTVFYNGRPLPKKVFEGGKRLVVTIPGDARSGHFELQLADERFRSKQRFLVR